MESHSLFGDTIRLLWIRPSVLPPPTPPNVFPTYGQLATSPLDHIHNVAQWYTGLKEQQLNFHRDAPILASRAVQLGNVPFSQLSALHAHPSVRNGANVAAPPFDPTVDDESDELSIINPSSISPHQLNMGDGGIDESSASSASLPQEGDAALANVMQQLDEAERTEEEWQRRRGQGTTHFPPSS